MKKTISSLPLAISAILACVCSAQSATLIHRYEFDSNLTDSVGTLNGTATGNATYLEAPTYVTAAPLGATGPTKAISLGMNAGTKNSGFSVGSAALDQTAGSLSMWLNPGTPPVGDITSDYVIYQPAIGTGMYVAINPNSSSTLTTRFGNTAVSASNVVTPGTWLNAVITWDSINGLKLYINGTLQGTQALKDFSATAGLRFGNFDLSNINNYLANQYKGLIYDVQTYSGVLTASEVSYLAANPGVSVPEPSAMMLGGIGLAASLLLVRRKRRQ